MDGPSIAAQVVALTKLSVPELRERWREVFGEETTQRHRQYMVKRLAWKLQSDAYGGLSDEAQARLTELQREFKENPPETWFRGARHNRPPTKTAPVQRKPVRDPNAPKAGTVLARDYKGHRITVRVIDGGYEWRGEVFKSLSAVANAITGSHVSGRAWFGLAGKQERS